MYSLTYIFSYLGCSSSTTDTVSQTTNQEKSDEQKQIFYINCKNDNITSDAINNIENISTIVVNIDILETTKITKLMEFIQNNTLQFKNIIFKVEDFNNHEFSANYNKYIAQINEKFPNSTIEYISNSNGAHYHYFHNNHADGTSNDESYYTNDTNDMWLNFNLLIWLCSIFNSQNSQEKIILDLTEIKHKDHEKKLKEISQKYNSIDKIEIKLPEKFEHIPALNNILNISKTFIISCSMNNMEYLSKEMANNKNVNSATEYLYFKTSLPYEELEKCIVTIDTMYNKCTKSKLEHIELSLNLNKNLNEKEHENIQIKVQEFNKKHNREELLNINIINSKEKTNE